MRHAGEVETEAKQEKAVAAAAASAPGSTASTSSGVAPLSAATREAQYPCESSESESAAKCTERRHHGGRRATRVRRSP
jgi:hypothetical protein